jgi:hypothetical protein
MTVIHDLTVLRTSRCFMSHRLLPIVLVVVAMALALPSLWVGLQLDDYVHLAIASNAPALRDFFPSRLDLFTFADGNPARTRRLMDRGILPWWTAENARLAFWRPATSLTHWLDYTVLPNRTVLMHLHSLGWFGILVLAATLMYRGLMGRAWSAGVAGLFYALDNTHAFGVAWLANRHALLATLFGALALWTHDRWRRSGWRAGRVWGPICFALGLMSSEAAVATGAYLVAHAVCLDCGPWRRRMFALLPYGAIAAGWQLLYQQLGYGAVAASPGYINPALEPLVFVRRLIEHGPLLLWAQWSGLPAENYTPLVGQAALARWLVALLGLGALGLVLVPLLRCDPIARFWALGHLAALPLIVAAPLADRYLFFVGLGAMGLLARFLCGLLDREGSRPASSVRRFSVVTLACFLAAVHLVVAPIQLARSCASVGRFGTVVEQSSESLAADPGVSQQRVVVANAPSAFFVVYAPFIRAAKGLPIPLQTLLLTATAAPVQLSRVDARTLGVRPLGPQDFLFRPREYPMALGEQVRLVLTTIWVTALTRDARPAEFRVSFDVDLEDPSLKWLQWRGEDGQGRYVTFTPPAIGQTVDVR